MNDDFEKFFSAIDSVPWPTIEHAFGPATDVPDLIRSLISPDVNVRNDAWSELHGNIWHQGTIYEASSYAVPVFLELLRQPATPGKQDVLAFLALLFTGRSYWDVHQHTPLLQSEVRKPGFQHKLEQELAWAQATKDAVVKGKETYLRLLEGDNSEVRIAAAYLLGLIGASDFVTLKEITKSAEKS